MPTTKLPVLALVLVLLACDANYAGEPCESDTGDGATTTTGGGRFCPDYLDPDWPGEPIGLLGLACHESPAEPKRVTCTVAMHLPVGHPGDFAVESSGAGVVGWNELPWNAEAGPWENASLVGSGTDCGVVAINGDAITEHASGARYFDLVLTDDSLGIYTTQRITLSPGDPVIEP